MSGMEEAKTKRIQTLVTPEKGRRIKAAAALRGLTIEQWLEEAADKQLAEESRR